MLCLKKVYRDELLQLALILSLLRSNHSDSYIDSDLYGTSIVGSDNTNSWRSFSSSGQVLRSHYVHPKSMDSMLVHYERDMFADLNSLGRYHRSIRQPNITAYLLNVDRNSGANSQETVAVVNPINNAENIVNTTNNLGMANGTAYSDHVTHEPYVAELSQEDMDLIEVLWKQDVDLGVPLEISAGKAERQHSTENSTSGSGSKSGLMSLAVQEDNLEKLKALKEVNELSIKIEPEHDAISPPPDLDPWAGFNYTIDTETGEYVIKGELDDSLTGTDCGPSCDLPLGDLSLPLPEFLLEQALGLVDLDDIDDPPIHEAVCPKDIENISASISESSPAPARYPGSAETDEQVDVDLEETSTRSSPTNTIPTLKDIDSDEELDILTDMIQTTQFHHPHHPHHSHHHRAAFQSRMPFVRTMSMEQRWQDLANLLSLPSPGDASGLAPHPFSHHHALNYGHGHPVGHHGMGMSYGGPDSPHATRGVLLHNATLTPPMGEINASSIPVPYGNIGGTNLGNAVATSMNLTNSSEPMGDSSTTPHYKLEPSHDLMYYQNTTSDLNQTDGFLSSILNDEDLQLMDMAMNEDSNNGNLTMSSGAAGGAGGVAAAGTGTSTPVSRVDVERMDTSSDSAVSSMGSERVPSLSDGEWCDAGSDSGHTTGDHYHSQHHTAEYHSKYRPYDYSMQTGSRHHVSGDVGGCRMPPVAQKKHQMFGKRYFQEQGSAAAASTLSMSHPIKYEYAVTGSSSCSAYHGEGAVPKSSCGPSDIKYPCTMDMAPHGHIHGYHHRPPATGHPGGHLDPIHHNHSYHLPVESTGGSMLRPISRDKTHKGPRPIPTSNIGLSAITKTELEQEHLTRDEKRARQLSVPISVDDIINLPMDEFNERLSKYDLSESQLSLIRDIRRRGKNKVAAQNCRKRKLDQILCLADEVKEMRDRKIRLLNEHDYLTGECQRVKDKYQQLYRHVFQNLRDPDGNHYSPYQYSLQTSADGSILVVPRATPSMHAGGSGGAEQSGGARPGASAPAAAPASTGGAGGGGTGGRKEAAPARKQ